MTRSDFKRGGWLAVWAAAVVLTTAVAVPSARALDIRVQGEAVLSMNARTAGTRLRVTGYLLDDLNAPLPQRDVRLSLRPMGAAEPTQQWTVTTDRKGRFETHKDVPPGQYQLVGRFAATQHVDGAEARTGVTSKPRPVELRIEAPEVVRLQGKTPVEIRVTARVGGEGLALPATLHVRGRQVAALTLDEHGRGRVEVSETLEVGTNRLTVRTEAGTYRDAARASARVRRVDGLRVEGAFESVLARLQRGASVSGRVVDRAGGVGKARVQVSVRPVGSQSSDQKVLRQKVTTGEAGDFEAFFDGSELSEGLWRARARVIPEVGAPVTVEFGELRIDHTLSRIVMYVAGGLALLALLVLVVREAWPALRHRYKLWRRRRQRRREREQAFDQQQTLETVAMPSEEGGEGWPSKTDVGGEVWDVWRQRPVPGATVRLGRDGDEEREAHTGEDGRFGFEDLEAGAWTLEAHAHGFVRATSELQIPHDGQLSRARFQLVAVPLKIRRLYQALVEEAEGRDLWGDLSPREIEQTVLEVIGAEADSDSEAVGLFVERLRALLEDDEQLEGPREYLEAMTGVVEETYFSGREYDEEVWHLARRLALRLRENLRAGQEAA